MEGLLLLYDQNIGHQSTQVLFSFEAYELMSSIEIKLIPWLLLGAFLDLRICLLIKFSYVAPPPNKGMFVKSFIWSPFSLKWLLFSVKLEWKVIGELFLWHFPWFMLIELFLCPKIWFEFIELFLDNWLELECIETLLILSTGFFDE